MMKLFSFIRKKKKTSQEADIIRFMKTNRVYSSFIFETLNQKSIQENFLKDGKFHLKKVSGISLSSKLEDLFASYLLFSGPRRFSKWLRLYSILTFKYIPKNSLLKKRL